MYMHHEITHNSPGLDPYFRKFRQFTVDPVISACLTFREFLILGLFTKFTIHDFSFSFGEFLNSRICPREIREN